MRDDGWDGALKTGSCSFRIEGDKGWVETGDATKIECSDNIKPLLRPTESASLALENHVAELVRCIRTRQSPKRQRSGCGQLACYLPRGVHRLSARQDPHVGHRQARVHQR